MQSNRKSRAQEDVDTAVARTTRMWNTNLFITVALLVLIFIFTSVRTGPMSISFGKEALTVTPPDKNTVTIDYNSISDLALCEDPIYGQCLEDQGGRQDSNCWFGPWDNQDWGTYWLCIRPGCKSCVILKTIDGEIYVINDKSSETTLVLLDNLEAVSGLTRSE